MTLPLGAVPYSARPRAHFGRLHAGVDYRANTAPDTSASHTCLQSRDRTDAAALCPWKIVIEAHGNASNAAAGTTWSCCSISTIVSKLKMDREKRWLEIRRRKLDFASVLAIDVKARESLHEAGPSCCQTTHVLCSMTHRHSQLRLRREEAVETLMKEFGRPLARYRALTRLPL